MFSDVTGDTELLRDPGCPPISKGSDYPKFEEGDD